MQVVSRLADRSDTAVAIKQLTTGVKPAVDRAWSNWTSCQTMYHRHEAGGDPLSIGYACPHAESQASQATLRNLAHYAAPIPIILRQALIWPKWTIMCPLT